MEREKLTQVQFGILFHRGTQEAKITKKEVQTTRSFWKMFINQKQEFSVRI
jgi:hypothetical protein